MNLRPTYLIDSIYQSKKTRDIDSRSSQSEFFIGEIVNKWKNSNDRISIAVWNYEITSNVFHTGLLFFYATQMIGHFLNSRISANHDKVEGHWANYEILIKRIETLFNWKDSLNKVYDKV